MDNGVELETRGVLVEMQISQKASVRLRKGNVRRICGAEHTFEPSMNLGFKQIYFRIPRK